MAFCDNILQLKNRDLPFTCDGKLFSQDYLLYRLKELEYWNEESNEFHLSFARIKRLLSTIPDTAELWSEEKVKSDLILKVVEHLGFYAIPEVGTESQPDFVLFESRETGESALKALREGKIGLDEFYGRAVAILEAKHLRVNFDRRYGTESPEQQMRRYLWHTRAKWGILTNGKIWRLYHRDYSHEHGNYYEIDICETARSSDKFKYFHKFFSLEAFRRGFQELVKNQSVEFRHAIEEALVERAFDNVEDVANELYRWAKEHGVEPDLEVIRRAAYVFLYRILLIFNAEDRNIFGFGRRFSLNRILDQLKEEYLAREWPFDFSFPKFWSAVKVIFRLIYGGSRRAGMDGYDGEIFGLDPHLIIDRPDFEMSDETLLKVLGRFKFYRMDFESSVFEEKVDYATLDVRHLGTIYERLLEKELHVAEERYFLYRFPDGSEFYIRESWIENGKVRRNNGIPSELRGKSLANATLLKTINVDTVFVVDEKFERKATGSYFTPPEIVELIVNEAVDPLLRDAAKRTASERPTIEAEIAELKRRIESEPHNREALERKVSELKFRSLRPYLELRILDPAMGSGHFLVNAIEKIATAMADDPNLIQNQDFEDTKDALAAYKRLVAENCIYGVDINALAVELAKLSVWISTIQRGKPFSYLDHHLKVGDSLVGFIDVENRLDHEIFGQFLAKLPIVIGNVLELLRTPSEHFADVERKDKLFEAVRKAIEPIAEHLDSKVGDVRDLTKPFHWVLEFPEAFYEFKNGRAVKRSDAGFDAVIGNPPYFRLKQMRDRSVMSKFIEFYAKSGEYRLQYGNYNLYKLFLERGYDLLKDRGMFGMIFPSAFLGERDAEKLREEIFTKNQVIAIYEFPERARVFHDVTQAVNVFVYQKDVQPTERLRFYPNIESLEKIESAKGTTVYVSEFEDIKPPTKFCIPKFKDFRDDRKFLKHIAQFPKAEELKIFEEIGEGHLHETNYADYLLFDRFEQGPVEVDEVIKGIHVYRYLVDLDYDGPRPRWVKTPDELIKQRKSIQKFIKFVGEQKVIIGKEVQNVQLAFRMNFCVLEQPKLITNTVRYIILKDSNITWQFLAWINSGLVNRRVSLFAYTNHIKPYEIGSIPLPESLLEDDELAELARKMVELRKAEYAERKELFMDLADIKNIDVVDLILTPSKRDYARGFWDFETYDFAAFKRRFKAPSRFKQRFEEAKRKVIEIKARLSDLDSKLEDRIAHHYKL